jgi:transketolase C-terminal domain/subunit
MDGHLQFLFPQKSMCKETRQCFNVCMHNGPVYMKILRNDVHNLWHVRIKRYQEFYHDIFYIVNEGRQIFFSIHILFDQKQISTANYQLYIKCQLGIYSSKQLFSSYKKFFFLLFC